MTRSAPAAPIDTGLALSILQPWAWLIVHGHKPLENRSWSTKVRGVINVHAGKGFDVDGYSWVRRTFPAITLPAPRAFDRGGIVGLATLVDVVSTHPSPFFFGPYGFLFADARPLKLQPCRGQLGFFRPIVPELFPTTHH